MSPDEPAKHEKMRQKLELSYPVLADSDLDVTARYGLLNDRGKLPHPAAITINKEGVVTWIRVDEDYLQRPSRDELQTALEGLQGSAE